MTEPSAPTQNQDEGFSQKPYLPEPASGEKAAVSGSNEKQKMWLVIAAVVVIVALVIAAVILLMQPGTPTGQIRDVFIIFMALESLVIGAALVILITQLATLINLLQHEIKPIIDSTNETVNTLRGTVIFLSNNVSEPVIKMNEYLAGLKRLLDLLSLKKK